jgi:hypothetical protein
VFSAPDTSHAFSATPLERPGLSDVDDHYFGVDFDQALAFYFVSPTALFIHRGDD